VRTEELHIVRHGRCGLPTRIATLLLASVVATLVPDTLLAQAERKLDENCTVSILNRSARVNSDGSWNIGGVPATGLARIRAVCRFDDGTVGGHTGFVELQPFQYNGFDAAIELKDNVPIADGMRIAPVAPILGEIGQQVQLEVTADLPNGDVRPATLAETGTNYSSSNSSVATVSTDGLVTAVMSGVAMVSAANEGALAIVRVIVTLGGDSDGDGIADDVEVALGMDPDNPADALEDFDLDGLTNGAEAAIGTDIDNDDTDFDGLRDGDEINTGTDPLDADSDNDGLLDGLETNPTDDDDDDGLINALDPDRDNDGLPDGVEDDLVGNPTGAGPNNDNDSDGLTNIDEIDHGTDPANRDTDADGLWDGSEVHGGCDPLVFDAPTIVVGRIVDSSDVPVAGAVLSGYAHRISSRVMGRSQSDGTFQLPGTTVCGSVQVSGKAFFDGRALQGASVPIAVLAGDLTDIGDVVLGDQPGDQFDLPRFPMAYDNDNDFRHILKDDFNGDGVLDLIGWRLDAGTPSEDLLTVLLGRPDGGFSTGYATRLSARTGNFSIDDFDDVDWATGDFNDDGNLDLVFTWEFENSATILPGRGDGTFSDSIPTTTILDARAVAVGDLNEDDHADLIIAFGSSDDNVGIYLGAGDATFSLSGSVPVGDDPDDLLVVDLNGDNHLDLVTANSDSNDVSVALGNGNGTFSAAPALAAGDHPHAIVFADANGDSLDDLVVLNRDSEDVSIFAGNGAGVFAAEVRVDADLDPDNSDRPTSIVVEELTGDMLVDILVVNRASSSVIPHQAVLLRASGGGNFAAELPGLPQSAVLREPIAIDINDDGLSDLVDIRSNDDVMTVINLGDGNFLEPLELGPEGTYATAFVSADFDGDNVDDLAFIEDSSNVKIARHNGAQPGTFFLDDVLDVISQGPSMLTVGDFDGDGILDLALARQVNNLTSSIWTARGLSASSFAAPVLVAQQQYTREIHAVDYDNDGKVDLVGRTVFGIFLMFNIGGGNLTAPTEIVPPGLAGAADTWMTFGDLDLDGFTDFLIGGSSGFSAIPDKISVWTSDGDATIEETSVVDIPGKPPHGQRATIADFNGDGFPDVAISPVGLVENALTGYLEAMVVLPGRGDGSFGEPILTPIAPLERFDGSENNFGHADFNGDGVQDLAWTGGGGSVGLLLGHGNGTFSAEHRYELGSNGAYAARAIDINGDMKADFVSATNNSKRPALTLLLHR
jgi:hypothetical protein